MQALDGAGADHIYLSGMRLCSDLEQPAVVVSVSQEGGLQSIAHEGRVGVEEVESGVHTGIHPDAPLGLGSRRACEQHITSKALSASNSRPQPRRL